MIDLDYDLEDCHSLITTLRLPFCSLESLEFDLEEPLY